MKFDRSGFPELESRNVFILEVFPRGIDVLNFWIIPIIVRVIYAALSRSCLIDSVVLLTGTSYSIPYHADVSTNGISRTK